MAEKILIIDSNSLIHRAYHALPPLETKTGEPVGAIYGFFSVLIKAFNDFSPDYAVAAFDLPLPTFRHKEFKDYKATRPPTPKDLSLQIPEIKEGLNSFGILVLEKEGFEADDLIGFVSRKAAEKGIESIILSGDMDTLQLAGKGTKIYLLKRGIKEAVLCGPEEVEKMYEGLKPEQLIDYKALKGDASDNIPGVPGIGEKTAIGLIREFGSLENIYEEIGKTAKIKESVLKNLLESKESAFLSKNLAAIRTDIPLKFDIEECRWAGYKKKAEVFFEKLGFKALLKRVFGEKRNHTLF